MHKFNTNIAYFIGALHSDGCIYKFNDKHKGLQTRMAFCVAEKSIPMVQKFVQIYSKEFNRKVLNIRKRKNGLYEMMTSINTLLFIEEWNEQLPKQISEEPILFGAYLAGMIDGDGNIHKKHNKDRAIKQCLIRIASGEPLVLLRLQIQQHINCGIHFSKTKNKRGQGCNLCFYITSKTIPFLKEKVLPHLTLPHKIRRLSECIAVREQMKKV